MSAFQDRVPSQDSPAFHRSGAPMGLAVSAMLHAITGDSTYPGLRVGVDVCDVNAFRRQLSTQGAARFLAGMYTEGELAYCDASAERLGARWAAKEAVAKAIGTGFRGLRPCDIEIEHSRTGLPVVRPANGASWPFGAEGWRWVVSMAHDGGIALAVAAAVLPVTGSPG